MPKTGPQTYDLSELQVECWCRTEIVWVPKQDILEGKTGSCGGPRCSRIAFERGLLGGR